MGVYRVRKASHAARSPASHPGRILCKVCSFDDMPGLALVVPASST